MTFPDEMDRKLFEINKRKDQRRKASDELKPCPFCGGKAVLTSYQYDPDVEDFWIVVCKKCHVELQCDSDGCALTSRKKAVQAWNKRAYEVKND